MYSVVNQLLGKKQDIILPDCNDNKELANNFMNYFVEKIDKIRVNFQQETLDVLLPDSNPTCINVKLTSFAPTTDDEIRQIVLE